VARGATSHLREKKKLNASDALKKWQPLVTLLNKTDKKVHPQKHVFANNNHIKLFKSLPMKYGMSTATKVACGLI